MPIAVVIDEAVELAKRFSTDDSGRFVNGMLVRHRPQAPPDADDAAAVDAAPAGDGRATAVRRHPRRRAVRPRRLAWRATVKRVP